MWILKSPRIRAEIVLERIVLNPEAKILKDRGGLNRVFHV